MTTEYIYEPALHEVRQNRPETFCLSNPTGPGHDWVKERFIGDLESKTPTERRKYLHGDWTPPLFGDFP